MFLLSKTLKKKKFDFFGDLIVPVCKIGLSSVYIYGYASAVVTVNHRAATVQANDWTPNQNNYNEVPSYTTFDLTTRYDLTPEFQARVGVLNMFDREPVRNPSTFNSGEHYDILGRRITAGVNYKF